jgi:hypothetical protein
MFTVTHVSEAKVVAKPASLSSERPFSKFSTVHSVKCTFHVTTQQFIKPGSLFSHKPRLSRNDRDDVATSEVVKQWQNLVSNTIAQEHRALVCFIVRHLVGLGRNKFVQFTSSHS